MTDAPDPAAPAADPAAPPAANPAPTSPDPAPAPDPAPSPDPKADPIAKGGDPDPAEPPAQKWPDDWRQQAAGEDKKLLERLGRYDSPAAVAKALADAQDKIRQGLKPKDRPSDKATEDEIKAYRAEAGIPDTVEDYVKAIELPDKRVIGDEDKPIVEAFSERALKMNIPPKDIAGLVDEYYAIQEEMANQQAEKDAEFKTTSLQGLREEWGGDFKANLNSMRPYFESVDGELFDNLMGGRLADGTRIGDHPGMIRFFVTKSLQENPAATVVPAGSNQMETIESEIKSYENRMREDREAWFKDTAAQERYRKLVDAKEKLAKT